MISRPRYFKKDHVGVKSKDKICVEVFEVSDLPMRMVTIPCGWSHSFMGDEFCLGGVAPKKVGHHQQRAVTPQDEWLQTSKAIIKMSYLILTPP